MAGHEATPNSETTETASPAGQNHKASYEGTRYGKGGNPGSAGSDASNERIVTRA